MTPRSRPTPDFPYWLVALACLAAAVALGFAASDQHARIFRVVSQGIFTTIGVTLAAFVLASILGLGLALMNLSGSLIARQTSRFVIEIVRGIPIVVLLFWIAFAGVPVFVAGWNLLATPL